MESSNHSNVQSHHSYHQQSRPPSVDSVNLGSIYSGFYPYVTSAGPSSLGSQLGGTNTTTTNINHHHTASIPSHVSSYQHLFPQNHHYASQSHYSMQPGGYTGGMIGNGLSSMYPSYNHHPMTANQTQTVPPAPNNNQQQTQSLPPNLNYQIQLSAQAAAAAAFDLNMQQQQQQTLSSMVSGLPVQSAQHAYGSGATNIQWPISPQSSSLPPMINNGVIAPTQYGTQSSSAIAQAAAMMTNQMQQLISSPTAPTTGNQNDYTSQYMSQYYLEYFQRFAAYQKYQMKLQNQKKIAPYKYNRFHTPCAFVASSDVNHNHHHQLVMVETNYFVGLYGLQEVFIEQCYPQLFLQTLLLHNHHNSSLNNSNSSSMINSDDQQHQNTGSLPFDDSQTAIDWIRVKQLNDSSITYELRWIFKVITMLFRQNGQVSGLDLSELLLELVGTGTSDDSEKLSQSGSEAAPTTKDYYYLVGHLRQLLMRGQRRVSITFAQNNGLFDHAMALSYLLSFLPVSNPQQQTTTNVTNANIGQLLDHGLMISTIRKFITTTLSPEDPLYVFYSHLLQIATNIVNQTLSSSDGQSTTGVIASTATAKIDKLESFIILLANEISFEKVEIADKLYRNLIDLMIALLKNDLNYILPDELFNNDRFTCLLVNECLEFARFHGQRLNPRLIIRKLEFAFELYDFGFHRHSLIYLTKIRSEIMNPNLDWKLLLDPKSKYNHFLMPESAINGENGLPDVKLLQNIWLYQMRKIFNRNNFNSSDKEFDSPFFSKTVEVKDDENGGEQETENINEEEIVEDADEENDKTDVVEDLEDEEVDVELETSESSVSKQEPSSSISSPQQQQPNKQTNASQETTGNVSLDQSMNNKHNSIQPNHHSTMVNSVQTTPVIDKSTLSSKSFNMAGLSPIESSLGQNSFDTEAPQMNNQQQSNQHRRSLPSISNQNIPRTLNPIMEIPSNSSPEMKSSNSESIDSSAATTTNTDNQSFKMNSLQSALPNFGENSAGSGGQFDHVDNSSFGKHQLPQTTPMFFQPPLPTGNVDSSAPFDFVSTNGRVSSIPAYDPINLNDTDNSQMSNDSNQYNHKNNEFLQSYNTSSTSNNQNQIDSSSIKKSSNAESSKGSPAKSNNGGLFNAIFGRLKPKNQMILPDDADPQIVYDPVSKRWIDKSAGDQSGSGAGMPPPPPKIPVFNASGPNQSSQSEPNSTLSSPTMNKQSGPPGAPTLPSLPTFSTMDALKAKTNENQPMANGNVPPATPFGAFIPPTGNNSSSNTNNAFQRSDIRRKRYIDVFNNQSSTK